MLAAPHSTSALATGRLIVPTVLGLACFLVIGAPSATAAPFKWGPFQSTIGFECGFEYTDNYKNSASNRVENLNWTVGPTFNGGLSLPIHGVGAGGEEIVLTTGFSYSQKFSLNDGFKQTFSAPANLNLVIPFHLAEWRFLLSEAFTFKDEPLESLVAIEQQKTSQFNNLLSLHTVRDLGRTFLSFDATRTDKFSPTDPETDVTDYSFTIGPGLKLREDYTLSLNTTLGMSYPSDPTKQETIGISENIVLSGQITPFFHGNITLGYSFSHLREKHVGPGTGIFGGLFDPETLPADNVTGINASIGGSYVHPLRPNTTYGFSFYHSPGVSALLKDSNVTEVFGASVFLAHRLTPTVTLTPTLNWTHTQSVGRTSNGQKLDLYSIMLALNRRITDSLSATFDYRYQAQNSNQFGTTYDSNRLTLKFNYTF